MNRFDTIVVIWLWFGITPAISAQDEPFPVFPLGGIYDFEADPYIAAATKFQSMGKEKGIATLVKIQEAGVGSHRVIILSRMLFKAKEKKEFRRPGLGSPHFVGDGPWPLEPIEIVDGVPFVVVRGYSLKGLAESAKSYLSYCIKECDWNDYQFKARTAQEKQAALNKLLAAPKWRGRTDGEVKAFLNA
jgi:hypothetical protein